MEQTLWVAANRPTRPEGWAARPDPTDPTPVFHTDPFGMGGFESFDAFLDEPMQHSASPLGQFTIPAANPAFNPAFNSAPAEAARAACQQTWSLSHAQQQQPQQHQANQSNWNDHAEHSHGQAAYAEPTHFSRAYSFGGEDHPHFDAFNHYILPDVPGGCESVDQLAVHIPFWPQLGSPQVAAGEARA